MIRVRISKGIDVILFKGVYRRSLGFPLISNVLRTATLIALVLMAVSSVSAFSQSLDRISCQTKTYTSAGNDTCRAFLTSKNSTHVYIALSSNNPAVTVPSTIMVSYYAGSKGFTANIASVKTAQTATITATLNGIAKSFTLYLYPSTTTTTTSGGAMSVNATSIGFGSVAVNTPVEQSVTVSSTGTAAITVNSASVTGTGFSRSGGTFPTTLNPGQSMTFQVVFDPQTTGTFSGQLAIASSVSTKTIPLSGVGASHQVALSWTAPTGTTDPAVGYNVYRALSGTTSYQRLNSTATTKTSYTDTSVQSGFGYNYVVKSVDAGGVESGPSNLFAATIP